MSQVGLFLKCAFSWYLRYVEELAPKTSARPFQGIFVHRAVEHMLEERLQHGALPALEIATDVFSTEFEKAKPLIEDWDGEDPGLVKDTGVTCTKVFYQEAAPKATPVVVEKTFHTTIRTADGKVKLPVLGRIDSIQVQTNGEKDYQDAREIAVASIKTQLAKSKSKEKKILELPKVAKPLRIHDLKVVTDKWSETDLDNDLQFTALRGDRTHPRRPSRSTREGACEGSASSVRTTERCHSKQGGSTRSQGHGRRGQVHRFGKLPTHGPQQLVVFEQVVLCLASLPR